MKNACFAATIALLSGCSLINSLDSVKPQANGPDAGTGGKGGKGGKGSGGREIDGGGATGTGGASGSGGTGGAGGGVGGSDASAGGQSTMDAGSGGSGAGTDSGAGGAVDSGGSFTPGGPNGAIVAYDPDNQKTFVLDPTDGHLVSSDATPRVLAIANDPATDYWYIFRQVGAVTGPAELQVKQLNTTTGDWRDVGAPVAVPNPAIPTVGVLNGRIAYLSTPNPAQPSATTSTFTVLDTTNAPNITVPARSRALPAGGKLALNARANPTDVGGSVTIALQAMCGATECVVSLLGETINATTIKEDASPTTIGSVSPSGGSMGFASTEAATPTDVILIPPLTLPGATPTMCVPNSGTTGLVKLLDSSHTAVGGSFPFDIENLRVSSAAFDPCHNIAFATSLLGDTALWSIPLVAGGTPQKLCASSGGGLLFEPYTHGVLRVTSNDSRFELYDLGEKDQSAPTLTLRTMHLPAVFALKTGVIAVRRPKNVCK